MTIEIVQNLWKDYQDAWADISTEGRRRLLHQSVTEDVTFTSPNADGQGFNNLVEHIGEFQNQFPGAHFTSNRLLTHNNQLLSEWTMFNKDGSAFLTGHSYARFNEQGRIVHLAGFWSL